MMSDENGDYDDDANHYHSRVSISSSNSDHHLHHHQMKSKLFPTYISNQTRPKQQRQQQQP